MHDPAFTAAWLDALRDTRAAAAAALDRYGAICAEAGVTLEDVLRLDAELAAGVATMRRRVDVVDEILGMVALEEAGAPATPQTLARLNALVRELVDVMGQGEDEATLSPLRAAVTQLVGWAAGKLRPESN